MTKSEPALPGSLLSKSWKEGIGFERKNRSGAFSDKIEYRLIVRLSIRLRGCALAMLVNLAVQGVGVQAFNAGTYEEKLLLLLTIAVVAACAAGGTLLALAIRRKQMK